MPRHVHAGMQPRASVFGGVEFEPGATWDVRKAAAIGVVKGRCYTPAPAWPAPR
jgi:hypothetical protein